MLSFFSRSYLMPLNCVCLQVPVFVWPFKDGAVCHFILKNVQKPKTLAINCKVHNASIWIESVYVIPCGFVAKNPKHLRELRITFDSTISIYSFLTCCAVYEFEITWFCVRVLSIVKYIYIYLGCVYPKSRFQWCIVKKNRANFICGNMNWKIPYIFNIVITGSMNQCSYSSPAAWSMANDVFLVQLNFS